MRNANRKWPLTGPFLCVQIGRDELGHVLVNPSALPPIAAEQRTSINVCYGATAAILQSRLMPATEMLTLLG
jgi:hypothetical protein